MTTRPSEPILQWFRETLKQRGLNTAALANMTGEKRSVVRNVLGGKDPLTVDQLVSWGQALDLKLEDMARVPLPELEDAPEVPKTPVLRAAAPEETDERFLIDPYGLHGEQAIKLAFALGVDFAFVARSAQLADSGVPDSVLKKFPDRLLIKLDAAYHLHNKPSYDEDGVTLVLSFDALYTCTIPWSAVFQVSYFIEPPDPRPRKTEPEPEGAATKAPFLRLVK